MQTSKHVFVFGYSGHSYVIIESLRALKLKIIGYFDREIKKNNPYNLSYQGYEKEQNIQKIVGNHLVFPSIGENQIRADLIELFTFLELQQFSLIDSNALISPSAKIGFSTFAGKGAIVNAQCEIGDGVILNSGCIVEHECKIDNYVHIAPGAILCGNVKIGKNSFIGANSVVRENVTIGNDVIIGAGSVVIKDITSKGRWAGNPLRKL